MKVLLQKGDPPEFFNATGSWESELSKAFAFPNLATALLFCQSRGLCDVKLVLTGEGCPYDIPLRALDFRELLSDGLSPPASRRTSA